MFREHLTPQKMAALYKNISENQWRKLTSKEYAALIQYNMAYLKQSTLQVKLEYYITYLSQAIINTKTDREACGLWLGIEKNLFVVCKDLAKVIEELNAENIAKNDRNLALSCLAPAA